MSSSHNKIRLAFYFSPVQKAAGWQAFLLSHKVCFMHLAAFCPSCCCQIVYLPESRRYVFLVDSRGAGVRCFVWVSLAVIFRLTSETNSWHFDFDFHRSVLTVRNWCVNSQRLMYVVCGHNCVCVCSLNTGLWCVSFVCRTFTWIESHTCVFLLRMKLMSVTVCTGNV